MSSTCSTLLTRVPVTRPPSLSGALEGQKPHLHPLTTAQSSCVLRSHQDQSQSGRTPSGARQPGKPQITASTCHPARSPESPAAGALGDAQTELSLDQVLQERDEAIAKKQAVEAELDTCKAKLQAVEAQLLEVLEEKLRLRQEVEAWEEDMQQLVRQRVESQLQRESRGALGAPVEPRTARAPWVRFPLGRWGRWR
ncbi:hypothetical protein MC885_010950 [Smutsia gigantea]|nr:hypothetical protein MC885_010950 [Smutsia gigantea]